MSSSDPGKLPYRRGVGVMLLNRDNLAWIGERHDMPGAWQMPQGGIHKGETPREAALRELTEETGVSSVVFLAESADWHHYDLPTKLIGRLWGGRYRGQQQKWFACRFTGEDREVDLDVQGQAEFFRWRWIKPEMLPSLIVPFKCALYKRILHEFSETIQNRPHL